MLFAKVYSLIVLHVLRELSGKRQKVVGIPELEISDQLVKRTALNQRTIKRTFHPGALFLPGIQPVRPAYNIDLIESDFPGLIRNRQVIGSSPIVGSMPSITYACPHCTLNSL
jgi:hypothetical protein